VAWGLGVRQPLSRVTYRQAPWPQSEPETKVPKQGGDAARLGDPPGVSVLQGKLDLRDVELGLVLHREPTGWGELQASALAVEDRQDSALTDLISRRLAGIRLGGATRKHSEISHAGSLAWTPAPRAL
jgi:hypothetical protein